MTAIGPYAASGVGRPSLADALSRTRNDLDDLLKQLATEKKSDTYAGLGSGRTTSLAMRSRLTATEAYQDVAKTVNVRIEIMASAVSRLEAIGAEYKLIDPNEYQMTSGSVTIAQSQAATDLGEAIAQLNVDVDGRFAFSGRSTDVKPVLSAEAMLADDGDKAGLTTVIAERKLADLGADGRGRIDVRAVTGSSFRFQQEASGPFGFKITSLSSTLTSGVATGPSGALNAVTLGVNGTPKAGEVVRVGLTLPDGSTEEITLTARGADDQPFGDGDFRIGATPAETAANMRASFDAALKTKADTDLTAASAFQAGEEFFNTPPGTEPRRVAGFDATYASPAARTAALQNATAIDQTGTAALTVDWYKGESGSDNPRLTAAARIDDGVSVGYGARADEAGTRRTVQTLAVFSSMTFAENDANGRARYAALADRTVATLGSTDTTAQIKTIAVDLASASKAIDKAGERHVATKTLAEDAIAGVEGVSKEEVSLKILALQTRLQASYQVTATLRSLSLVNFL